MLKAASVAHGSQTKLMPSTPAVPRPPAARTHPSWHLLPLHFLWMANRPLELKEVLEGPPSLASADPALCLVFPSRGQDSG